MISTFSGQKRDPPLMLLTAAAGLIPALIAICAAYPIGRHGFLLPGVAFGAMVSGCLMLRRYFRSLWQMVAITAASTLAYYVSIRAAVAVELYSPFGFPTHEDGTVSRVALFAGGLVGAFLVLGAVSVLLNSDIAWERRVLKAFCWSPVGGVLGVLGWTLGPSLGMALWSVVHPLGLTAPAETFQNARGETSHMYSLWILWQTGVGFLLGLVLHRNRANEIVPKPDVR